MLFFALLGLHLVDQPGVQGGGGGTGVAGLRVNALHLAASHQVHAHALPALLEDDGVGRKKDLDSHAEAGISLSNLQQTIIITTRQWHRS